MSKLQKLQCEQCAGKIDGITLTCQSCGMQYRLNEDFTLGRVEVYNRKFQMLEGKIAIPSYVLYETGAVEFSEMTLRGLAEGMAEKILPFMEFKTMFSPMDDYYITTVGTIKVAEPSSRNSIGDITNYLSDIKRPYRG